MKLICGRTEYSNKMFWIELNLQSGMFNYV